MTADHHIGIKNGKWLQSLVGILCSCTLMHSLLKLNLHNSRGKAELYQLYHFNFRIKNSLQLFSILLMQQLLIGKRSIKWKKFSFKTSLKIREKWFSFYLSGSKSSLNSSNFVTTSTLISLVLLKNLHNQSL